MNMYVHIFRYKFGEGLNALSLEKRKGRGATGRAEGLPGKVLTPSTLNPKRSTLNAQR